MKNFPTHLEYSLKNSKRLHDKMNALDDQRLIPSLITGALLGIYQEFERYDLLGIKLYMQTMALWMFVPCGEDGKPMGVPFIDDFITITQPEGNKISIAYSKALFEYQAAQEKVLFEGWGVHRTYDDSVTVRFRDYYVRIFDSGKVYLTAKAVSESITIDRAVSIVPEAFTPTQSAIKQLNR